MKLIRRNYPSAWDQIVDIETVVSIVGWPYNK
jgi:hypothetical protein